MLNLIANQNDEVRMYLNLGSLLSKYINVSFLALTILLRNKRLILSLKFTNRSHRFELVIMSVKLCNIRPAIF